MLYDGDGNGRGLLHELRLLPRDAAPHRAGAGAPRAAAPGTEVHLELAVNHHNTTVLARTTKLPFFNPARKT